MGNKKKIAVLGCFRSGTNYSKSLLELNFDCNVRNNLFGWKHGFVPIVSSDSNVTYETSYDAAYFVTKNPFSFLVSLYRYYKDAKLNIIASDEFDKFIRGKIVIFDGGNRNSPQLRFANPVELWNSMNWNYKSCNHLIHVRYEMLLSQPQITTNKLARRLGVKPKTKVFEVPQRKVKRMNDRIEYLDSSDMQTKQKFNKRQYLDNEYMEMFSPELVEFVLAQLDYDLVEALGYSEIINDLAKSN